MIFLKLIKATGYKSTKAEKGYTVKYNFNLGEKGGYE